MFTDRYNVLVINHDKMETVTLKSARDNINKNMYFQ